VPELRFSDDEYRIQNLTFQRRSSGHESELREYIFFLKVPKHILSPVWVLHGWQYHQSQYNRDVVRSTAGIPVIKEISYLATARL